VEPYRTGSPDAGGTRGVDVNDSGYDVTNSDELCAMEEMSDSDSAGSD
jgi:hypothetical protein